MATRLTYSQLVTNENVRRFVTEHLCPMFRTTRDERAQDLEQRWLHFHKIFNVELDDQSYQGRSRVYISAGRNAIETWKIALLQALFPYTDWFDVTPLHRAGMEGNANAQKALQRRWLQKMQLRRHLAEFLQQFLTFGTGVLYHTWEDEEEPQRFWEPFTPGTPTDDDTTVLTEEDAAEHEDDPLSFKTTRGDKVRLVERTVKTYYGPKVRCVDLFHFFVAPTTALDVQDAELVFEDMTVGIDYLEAMHEEWMDPERHELGRLYDMIDEIVQTKGGRIPHDVQTADWDRRQREGLEQDQNIAFGDLEEGFVNLTNAYWRGEIPDAKDPETGEKYGCIDWKITVANDKWPVRIHPNPSYRNRRPWHVARLVKLVDEFYGRSMVEPFASIGYMLNDVANLTLDSAILALNPIAAVNSENVTNFDTLQLAPGAKWFFDGPPQENVSFLSMPNVSQLGMAMMSMMQGLIQDFSGANFAVQGVPAPRGRGRAQNTATGMALLQQTGSAGFQVALEGLQDEVMVPLLEANYEMQEQFMSDRERILIPGRDGVALLEQEIGFEDVIGHYLFVWKGAQQKREQMAFTQGLQGIVQMLAQIRMADPEAASQFRIKWGALARRFLTDGLGVSWADEVIETPEDQASVDPQLELDLMARHRPVEVAPGDDDQWHLQVEGQALMEEPFASDPIAAAILMQHVQAHVQQAEAKMQAQQMAMMQQQMMQGGPPGFASGPSMNGQGGAAQLATAQAQPSGVANQ